MATTFSRGSTSPCRAGLTVVEGGVSAGSAAVPKAVGKARRVEKASPGADLPGWAAEVGQCYPLLPDAPGANGTVTVQVGYPSRREVSFYWVYQDGKPSEGGVGSPAGTDVTLSVDASEAGKILSGQLRPSVAFMRGRLKTSGDESLVLALLRSSADPGFSTWLRKVCELASFERSD